MLQPRKNILELPASTHGGKTYGESLEGGKFAGDIIDFSANANPYGPPPGTRQILAKADIVDYPDSDSTELRRALARHLGLNSGNLLMGNGATEIIRTITTAFLNRRDRVLIPRPTYGEYEMASRIMDARIVRLSSLRKSSFRLTAPGIIEAVHNHHPKLLFLGSPNNPTGQYYSEKEIRAILSECRSTLLVLDEAYISFVEDPWKSTDYINSDNLIIVRSMTKDYALAGLRLGYAISNPGLISILSKLLPPWNVSSVAQIAGIHAIKDKTFISDSNRKINHARSYLIRNLNRLGLKTMPSSANFFLVRVGDAPECKKQLLNRGILVRDCTSFGLPQYIRISPRNMPDCKKFINAISEVNL